MPRNPDKRPCTYPGCRCWAMRDSDPPYCFAHARLLSAEPLGPPLPAWAEGGAPSLAGRGAPPGNRNRVFHGFYRRTLDPEEAGEVAEYFSDFDIHGHRLDSEILIGRVVLRRALAMLQTGTTLDDDPQRFSPPEQLRLMNLAYQGLRAIARLVSVQQQLGNNDFLEWALDQALDELSEEWGIEL